MHRYLLMGELLLIVLPITGLFIIFVPVAMSDMPDFTSLSEWKVMDIYAITSIVLAPWALLSLWVISIKYIVTPVKYNVSPYGLLGLLIGILLCLAGAIIGDDPVGSVIIFGLPIIPAAHLLVLTLASG